MSTAKILIPNKEWLITDDHKKVGSISKEKKGYNVLRRGQSVPFKSLAEIKEKLGIALFEESVKRARSQSSENLVIYDFPCSNRPYEPVYDVKKKLPLFAKSSKSKSQYCAGYYVIRFRKGWVKSFCPKLITLERYPYYGPFKTENEMKFQLTKIVKHEAA
jgi:hypothetical protein